MSARTGAILVLLLGLGLDPGAGLAADELSIQATAATDESGARVVLTFSRPAEYRLEETRSRLRLILEEPVWEASMTDQDVESDVLRRIRFDPTSRGTDIVFYLGRGFDTFTTSELTDPFRVVLRFLRRGALRPLYEKADPHQPETTAPVSPEAEPLPERMPSHEPGETRNVMIDPGHGGEEGGAASRSGLKEKDLVLDIARRLRARLQESGYEVALTREEDQSLDLTSRTARANHVGADLFLSIHANSSLRTGARGAETYFLSSAARDDPESMSLALQENLAGSGDAGSGSAGDDDEIVMVLWDMAQSAYLSGSSRLADLIQQEMNALAGIKNRGVKQAPFRVLVGATMPAVLVEVGFLSNEQEEKQLATQEYREQIAQALAAAVERFRQEKQREEGTMATAPGGAPR